jgi:hypothetical protein
MRIDIKCDVDAAVTPGGPLTRGEPSGCLNGCLKCFVTMRNVLEQGQKGLRGCFTGEAGGSIIL